MRSHSAPSESVASVYFARRYQYAALPRSPSLRCRYACTHDPSRSSTSCATLWALSQSPRASYQRATRGGETAGSSASDSVDRNSSSVTCVNLSRTWRCESARGLKLLGGGRRGLLPVLPATLLSRLFFSLAGLCLVLRCRWRGIGRHGWCRLSGNRQRSCKEDRADGEHGRFESLMHRMSVRASHKRRIRPDVRRIEIQF